MYFKQNTEPFVETLEQLLDKKSVAISTLDENIYHLYKREYLNKDQHNSLMERIIKYREHKGLKDTEPFGPAACSEMINRLLVILLSSWNAETFEVLYSSQNDRYTFSPHKYISTMMVHYIFKPSIIFHELKFA